MKGKLIAIIPLAWLMFGVAPNWAGPQAKPSSDNSANRQRASLLLDSTAAAFTQDHDAGKATQGYREVAAIDPSYPLPIYNLGLLAESNENWEEAQREFMRFLELDDGTKLAERAKRELETISRIQTLYKSPADKQRLEYDLKIQHSQVLEQLGFAKEAFSESYSAFSMDPNRWEAYVAAAEALSASKRFSEAEDYLAKARKLAPPAVQTQLDAALRECGLEEQFQSMTQKGANALQSKRFGEAATDFGKAWQLFSNRDDAALAYATAMAMGGKYDAAVLLFSHLRGSRSPDVATAARDALAKIALRNIAHIPLTEADRHVQSASAALVADDLETARKEYELATHMEPNAPLWHSKLASVLSRQSAWKGAEVQYRLAYLLDRGDLTSLGNIGAALLQQNQCRSAIDIYTTLVDRQPTVALNHDHLGSSYFLCKEVDKAIGAYKEAVRLSPGDHGYQSHLEEAVAAANTK